MTDFVLPFHVVGAGVRGRLIRLSEPSESLLRQCRYPQPAARLLAEAQLLAGLLGSGLKNARRLTLHASGDGAFINLSADYFADGMVRGFLSFDAERLARWTEGKNGTAPDPFLYLGKGHLALTVDTGPDSAPYQGIVALEGVSLTAAVMRYLEQSEQLQSTLRMALEERIPGGAANDSHRTAERPVCYRGNALLLQKIGGSDDDDGLTRAAALLKTLGDDELSDRSIAPETLLYRLFHEDGVEVYPRVPLRYGCTCSQEKMRTALATYTPEALESPEPVEVTCRFCGHTWVFGGQSERAHP